MINCLGVPAASAICAAANRAASIKKTKVTTLSALNNLQRVRCSAFEDTFSHPIHNNPVFLVLSQVDTKTIIINDNQRYPFLSFLLFPRFSILNKTIFLSGFISFDYILHDDDIYK